MTTNINAVIKTIEDINNEIIIFVNKYVEKSKSLKQNWSDEDAYDIWEPIQENITTVLRKFTNTERISDTHIGRPATEITFIVNEIFKAVYLDFENFDSEMKRELATLEGLENLKTKHINGFPKEFKDFLSGELLQLKMLSDIGEIKSRYNVVCCECGAEEDMQGSSFSHGNDLTEKELAEINRDIFVIDDAGNIICRECFETHNVTDNELIVIYKTEDFDWAAVINKLKDLRDMGLTDQEVISILNNGN